MSRGQNLAGEQPDPGGEDCPVEEGGGQEEQCHWGGGWQEVQLPSGKVKCSVLQCSAVQCSCAECAEGLPAGPGGGDGGGGDCQCWHQEEPGSQEEIKVYRLISLHIARGQESGARGDRSQEQQTRSKEPGARGQESGARGARSQELGARI